MAKDEKEKLPVAPTPNELARAYGIVGFAAVRTLWNECPASVGVKPLPTERSKREWGILRKGIGTYGGFYTALGVQRG